MDFDASGAMLTAFFVGSLIMRFCGPLILRKMIARKAYILFSLLSAAMTAAALVVANPVAMAALIVTGGFMQGSNVAFLVLMCIGSFPHRVASASSITVIAGCVAAMTAPLWMGGIAQYAGFRTPLLLGCALMVFSVVLVSRAKMEKLEAPVDAAVS